MTWSIRAREHAGGGVLGLMGRSIHRYRGLAMKIPRVVCVFVVFALAVVLAGCTADISGRVVSRTTGAGVASATVTWNGQAVSTDADGVFRLIGVSNGTQSISAAVQGYAPFSVSTAVAKDIAPVQLLLEDSAVAGSITEVAVESQTVTSATVSIGERGAQVAEDGTFSASGLRPGETTVTVKSANRITRAIRVVLAPGANSVDATMSLTAKETYRRYNAASTYGRYKTAYKYLHPDVRKLCSYKKFKTDMSVGTDISFKMGGQRILKSFRSLYTKKVYNGVTQIDRRVVTQYAFFGKITDNRAQHWQLRPDGKWYLIWNFRR